jgi:hypothetical protein
MKRLIPFLCIGYIIFAFFASFWLGQIFLHYYHTYSAGVAHFTPKELAPLAVLLSASILRIGVLLCLAYLLFRRSHRIAALVLAAISCVSIPVGTILGGVTIYTLTRPEVRVQFAPTV